MAKIDLGAHIDGFIAVVAHTVVVGKDKVSGKQVWKLNTFLARRRSNQSKGHRSSFLEQALHFYLYSSEPASRMSG